MKNIIGIAMLVALLTVGCQQKSENKEKPELNDWGEALSLAIVEERPYSEELLLSGNIVADERRMSHVVMPIGGKISGITAERGDHVAKGSVLAMVSSTEAAEYQRDLQVAQSEVRLAQRELSMKEQLHKDGMASDKEVGESRERLHTAETILEGLQSVGHINGYASKSSATITAPVSGTILERMVYNNQFVQAGSEAFVIADMNRVWAVADVYETDISRIHEGDSVTVETMAWPGERFHGRIDKVFPVLSDASKTMNVRVDLSNPDGKLHPGMFASLHVMVGQKLQKEAAEQSFHTLPSVPSEAVVFENGHHFVIVRDSQSFHRQEVSIVREAQGYVYLNGNITVGQQVVSKNALLMFSQLGQ